MNAEFDSQIKDPDLPAIVDLSYPGRPLLIAFGGIVGSLGIPPFEFFNLTKDLDINKIYLRDLRQTWYHSGLPGISTSIDETAAFLRSKIDESGTDKVVVLGNSMGGYAAIVFGILIEADIIHAFSPQTSITSTDYVRSKKQIQNVHDNYPDKYFELKDLIESYDDKGVVNIYYNTKNKMDAWHSTRLQRKQHIVLHPFSGLGHDLIKALKKSGALRTLIVDSLIGGTAEAADLDESKQRSFLAKLFGAAS